MKSSHLCLALVALTVSCKQNREIKVYKVAREAGAESQTGPSAPNVMPGGVMPDGANGDPHAGLSANQMAAVGATGGPEISDTPPAHWKKQPASSMRQASYLVEGEGGASADISLVILRGVSGGELDNVNRWRGQLGLKPIDEAALKDSAQTVSTPLGEAVAVEIEGLAADADPLKDGRMLGVIAHKDGDGWFYKMRGNSALAAAEKDNFMRWVASVKPGAPGSPPASAGQPAPVPPATGSTALTWQVPDGWTLVPGASTMRYATFSMTGADGAKAEMAVSHFPGDVGGDLENVNRWRQQVGLTPVDAAGMAAIVSKIAAGPEQISLIDVTGAENRLAAGWTRHGPDTWFFKLTGPDAVVGAEKAKFTAFLASVRFNTPE